MPPMAGPNAIPAAKALINGLNVLALFNGVLTSDMVSETVSFVSTQNTTIFRSHFFRSNPRSHHFPMKTDKIMMPFHEFLRLGRFLIQR
mmetsp:Transcript_11974/g.22221  ORF Transcript_11974/g.22221 Transcript_11974/m.22221 type:complete len:89 (+) Transcript_11974:1095-1361(+)